jgi:hypothetical protein
MLVVLGYLGHDYVVVFCCSCCMLNAVLCESSGDD